jgi:chromate transporter
LWKLAVVFTRYANLTLGGGSATAATMHRELVVKRNWLTEDQFTLSFALGRVTPGPNLLAFCTGFGWIIRGPTGAIVALLASSMWRVGIVGHIEANPTGAFSRLGPLSSA